MATLLLQAAGAGVGGLFGPVGAMIGRAAGALAGNLIDRSLISGLTTVEGTPLESARKTKVGSRRPEHRRARRSAASMARRASAAR